MSFKLVTAVLLFINFHQTQQIHGTRIPLEVYEPSKTHQVAHNSSPYHNNQRGSLQNSKIGGDLRRGRQMLNGNERGPRILYQVGNSEEDLPTCAPNAVCSKVDLYETPWIERQCRCPEMTTSTNSQQHQQHIIYHHKSTNNNQNLLQPTIKYQQYYEDEKRLQQKRLLDLNDEDDDLDGINSNIDEHKHIREILRKLGALYDADDIITPTSSSSSPSSSTLNHNDNNQNDEPINDDDKILNENHHKNHNLNFYNNKKLLTKRFRHHGGGGGQAHRFDFPKINGCSSHIGLEDGHTIADKTRQYKLCDPVHKLPTCRYFRDYTWTLISSPDANATEQIVHCKCPKNSITYLIKRESLPPGKSGYTYLFACSPQSRLRCLRKEPCKLFTVRKRQEFLDEVNTNPLCQCPRGHACPKHHTDSGVISGKSYVEDNIRTYAGYCMAN